MKILREVASVVDGYDVENFGNNKIIDLDKQSWTQVYDVITSFETIEHLAKPDFFLSNVQRTTKLLVLSTPLWEKRGDNPFHKQQWTFDSISDLLERRFKCDYLFQDQDIIAKHVKVSSYVFAVCTPRGL